MRARCAVALGVFAAAALVVALPGAVEGYCLNKVSGATPYASWKTQPVKYKVSANLTDPAILKAIDDAFATWGSVACSKLAFQKDGTFNLAATNFQNHNQKAILVFWYDAAAGYPTDAKYLAYTFFGHDNAGGLVQGSIALNGFTATYPWDTTGDAAKLDVHGQLVTLIGQVIGFTTSNTAASVMQDTITFGDTSKRTLAPDDVDAVHQLYKETNCPAPPAPGANGCTGSAPGPDGSVVNPDGGVAGDGPAPKQDGNTAKADGATAGDGKVSSQDQGTSGADGGGRECEYSTQCASDEVCTAEGKCLKISGGGGDDGGCCSVAADRPPLGSLVLTALLCGLWLATRRRSS